MSQRPFLEQSALAQSTQGTPGASDVITNPADALDVFDFEEAAHRKVNPGHWAYMISGVDDDGTLRANREGFKHIELRPRRLRDATKVDMRVELFGTTYNSPIFLCPTGGEKSFDFGGELAAARAAKARGTLQFLSTVTSTRVEDVNKALGRPVWQQLYAPSTWEACGKILQRVESAGCTVIALTVDNTTGNHRETFLRGRPKDLTQCTVCHESAAGPSIQERPMYDGINMSGVTITNPAMDWAFADRIRKFWKGKFIIKGIDTHEDAQLCLEHGIDGIPVSNYGKSHGNLAPDHRGATRGCRSGGRPHSGVRRWRLSPRHGRFQGSGPWRWAAVVPGAPYIWGLGAFGQAGVDRVIEILQGELKLAMGNCGTRTVAEITHAYVSSPDWKL